MADLSVAQALRNAEQLFLEGKLDAMERLCRSILESTQNGLLSQGVDAPPGEAHRLLGLAAYSQGKLEEAIQHANRSLVLNPGEAAAHDNLALYYLAQGNHARAEIAARQALSLRPSLVNAANNLGLSLIGQGKLLEALPVYRSTLQLEPANTQALDQLVRILEQLNRPIEALEALQEGLKQDPNNTVARQTLLRLQEGQMDVHSPALSTQQKALKLLEANQPVEAEKLLRQALAEARQQPALAAEIAFHLGGIYFQKREFDAAENAYRLGLSLEASRADRPRERTPHILNNFGNQILNPLGRIAEARAAFLQALSLQPHHAICHSNFLLNEQYSDQASLVRLAQAHEEYDQRHARPLRSTWKPFPQSRDPDRQLRIGFLSGDLHHHPVGLTLAPVLERLDKDQWLTVCYANQIGGDAVTERLIRSAGLWRQVSNLEDARLAEQIRSDQIDLLVDLSGHTGNNRLLTLARRPAPLQLSWFGYVGTTGLSAIQYLLADRFHVPPGAENHYREKVLLLPHAYACYDPPTYLPECQSLPALSRGHITFGCFNNLSKMNDRVISTWAEILHKVPRSRLKLKYHWFDDIGIREEMLGRFARKDIAAEKIEFVGQTGHADHLHHYNSIDLALDPFPYSGGLTTLEALIMGVPVITCPGETFAGRHAFSYLSNLGMRETIAATLPEYIHLAIRLAGNVTQLQEWRSQLRARMMQSPLCDSDGFTRALGNTLRMVWRIWCQSGE